MLQQTRVAAVLEHYANWMMRFPNLEALASAPEDDVLAAWSGLGYYRRARFLHQGAKVVMAEFEGRLPETAALLRKLPGIGAYTSAAIASIVFGEVSAAVDGNVERVLLRQTGSGENGAPGIHSAARSLTAGDVQNSASRLIDPLRPGDFNQAMMELGATVCLPRNPLCLQCPVEKTCLTRGEHPVAARKSSVNADICYGYLQRESDDGAEVLLEQRSSAATVMPGMWELPRVEEAGVDERCLLSLRHSIMQTNYRVTVVELSKEPDSPNFPERSGLRWVAVSELSGLPLTGLARKTLRRLGLFARG